MSEAVLEIKNLTKHFPVKKGLFRRTVGYVKAVDGVTYTINKGETLGLIGESGCGKTTVGKLIMQLIKQVGLNEYDLQKYPHEFSGGQRQRIVVARALAMQPKIIVCDEPVSALDVSMQAQILNLLKRLQHELGVSFLFIAHGMAVVKHISDRAAVMYLGKIVEIADSKELFENCRHPYTQALISSVPDANPHFQRERIILEGEVPNPIDPPSGCRFHTRCSRCMERCKHEEPELRDIGNGHQVACFLEQ